MGLAHAHAALVASSALGLPPELRSAGLDYHERAVASRALATKLRGTALLVLEMIDDLKSMAREIMIEYFNANGGASNPESRPERVLFYRDGVSESQFQAVLSDELPCLRQAFQSLGDGSYNPTITYIVAQKRHNTRLFVSNPQDGEGRNKDVPAGTVVDTGRAVSLPFIFFWCRFPNVPHK